MCFVGRSGLRSGGDDGEGNLFAFEIVLAPNMQEGTYDGGNDANPNRYH